VAERQLPVHVVAVAASLPDLREVAGCDEILDDHSGRSLGDADNAGDISEAAGRVTGDRLEHVRVVRHEPPAVVVVRGCRLHRRWSASLPERLLFERLEEDAELANRHHAERRPYLPLAVDPIAVSTADARLRQMARLPQVGDDLSRRSFRDPDALGDVSQPGVRVGSDADQDLAMVREEAPGRRFIS